jgi:regulator of chromosome condensation
VTWGVNDDGALGRDTPAVELADADDEDDPNGWLLNPYESVPTAVQFKDNVSIAQVTATDSACFALTSEGNVYGWGSFGVSRETHPFTT